jgi:saccharopine dehydrogenase (NAD+, L-lysine-forming)
MRCHRAKREAAHRRGCATYAIDAEDVPALTALIKQIGPKLVVNLALPYQDLTIMERACGGRALHGYREL